VGSTLGAKSAVYDCLVIVAPCALPSLPFAAPLRQNPGAAHATRRQCRVHLLCVFCTRACAVANHRMQSVHALGP